MEVRYFSLAGMAFGGTHVAVILLTCVVFACSALAADRTGMVYQLPPGQYQALVDLYNATDGPNWTDSSGWLDGEAEQWFGVNVSGVAFGRDGAGDLVVTQKGNVIGLRLEENQLNGELSSTLGDLRKLVFLGLSKNQLSGQLPGALKNWGDLKTLSLSGNDFSGILPDWLGTLTNLDTLDLSGNDFSGILPDWLGTLTNLYELNLSGNQFSGSIPDNLNQLEKLVVLALANNRLTGPIPQTLTQFPFILNVLLNGNLLTGEIPSTLANLTNSPFGGTVLDLQGNCLGLSNVATVEAGWGGIFRYSPQGDCTPPDPPDLRCAQFKVLEDEVQSNDPITVEFQIENRGPGSFDKYRVSFYLSADVDTDFDYVIEREHLKTIELPPLKFEETTTVQTEKLELPFEVRKAGMVREPNQFYIHMVIDPFKEIEESDETNNIGHPGCPGYDKIKIFGPPIIASTEFDAYHLENDGEGLKPGQRIDVEWELLNVGYGDAESFFLLILFDDPPILRIGDGLLAKVEIEDGLRSGEPEFGTTEVMLPPAGSDVYEPQGNGLYTIRPHLDPFTLEHFDFSQLAPADEIYGDNVDVTHICAELRAGDITISKFRKDFRPGDVVPFTTNFRNDSPVLVESPFEIDILLSKDPIIDPAVDEVIGTVPASGADRHTRHIFIDQSVTLPPYGDPFWVPGNQRYFLGIMVDSKHEVEEDDVCCDRSDNASRTNLVAPLFVNSAQHQVGAGVNGGTGTPTAPYITAPGTPVTGLIADPGASLSFVMEDIEPLPGRENNFHFECPIGSGFFYIRLDDPPTPDNYDYRIAFNDENRGPFDVRFYPAYGRVHYLLETTDSIENASIGMRYTPLHLPFLTTLVPSSTTVPSWFGHSVAVAGNTVAFGTVSIPENSPPGAVCLYRWDGYQWLETKVTHRDERMSSSFGSADGITMSGDRMAIADKAAKKVTFFRKEVNDWQEESSLNLTQPEIKSFGTVSFSLSGNTFAVGVPASSGGSGAVSLYTWNGENWIDGGVLNLEEADVFEYGSKVELSGNTLAVHFGRAQARGWSIDLYRRQGDSWKRHELRPEIEGFENRFNGLPLSASEERVAVGAKWGSVFVYEWNGTQWVKTIVTEPRTDPPLQNYGGNVALSGSSLAVASQGAIDIYHYSKQDNNWKHEGRIVDTIAYDTRIDLDGDLLALGTSAANIGTSPGHVYNLAALNTPTDPAALLRTFSGPQLQNVRPLQPIELTLNLNGIDRVINRHRQAKDLNVILMKSRDLRNWIEVEAPPRFESSSPDSDMEIWTTLHAHRGSRQFFRLSVSAN